MTPTPVPDDRPQRIRDYYTSNYGDLPLAAIADVMVREADRVGIDWRLIPVIGLLESSGGKYACGGNAWGYASCQVRFDSFEEGASVVADTLAEPLYTDVGLERVFCIWVSGGEPWCASYVDRAMRELGKLGPR